MKKIKNICYNKYMTNKGGLENEYDTPSIFAFSFSFTLYFPNGKSSDSAHQ